MKTAILNGIILTPDQTLRDHILLLEDGRITALLDKGGFPLSSDFSTIDAEGCFIIPGLIDIHVHGANGADTMDGSPEALTTMAVFFARHGVTAFLPTTVTASQSDTLQAIENISHLPPIPNGAQPLGIHLEGPYLHRDYCGAQPPQHLRPADPAEYRLWLQNPPVRLITVAPEVEGVMDLIRAGRQCGIEFAVGHSQASYEQVIQAVEIGVHQVTHTFNGMPPLHHRMPGVVGAALSDPRLYTQIIPDGIHVHPAVIKILLASKGIDHTIAITDAIRAAGLADGEYRLGDQTIQVVEGIARTATGSLAGSTLTYDQALRNMMQFANLSLPEALPMFTRVPARALGLEQQKGSLKPGADADLVFLDVSYRVRLTMVAGQIIYQNLH
jgi:N-acetylglucosamine-6-phosphate deacetylase